MVSKHPIEEVCCIASSWCTNNMSNLCIVSEIGSVSFMPHQYLSPQQVGMEMVLVVQGES